MLIIRGVNVFPSQVETALLQVEGVTPNYQILVDRIDNKDTFDITVEIEDRFFSSDADKIDDLQKKIEHSVHQVVGLNAKIKLAKPKTIERFQGKAVRAIDKRKLV